MFINKYFINSHRLIIFKSDRPQICNIKLIRTFLEINKFEELKTEHQNVWMRIS